MAQSLWLYRVFDSKKCALLLLPTLSRSLDIIISLCLDLLINFFEELDILNVTLIIFFKTALDFFKIMFNQGH